MQGCTLFVILMMSTCFNSLSNSLEFFSAIADLEKLLHSEKEIAHYLKSYVAKEAQRLEILNSIAGGLEEHSNEALQNPERFLSNPINAFKLVRRFTSDWSLIVRDYVQSKNTEDFLDELPSMTKLFPDEEDLMGSAVALFRLVDTYALDPVQVALGNILNHQNSPPLTAYECFELGKLAFDQSDHYHSALFMNASVFLLEREDPQTVSKFLALDYLAYSLHDQGNILQAYMITLNLLQMDPGNERLLRNKEIFQEALKDSNPSISKEVKLTRQLDEYRNSEEFSNYEKLCRGEKTKESPHEHRLKCRSKRHHPMFYVKPLREEEVHLKPRITVYRDFLLHDDVALVKQLSSPKLNRATVQNSQTGKLETAPYRVSKSAWLRDVEHVKISRISQRTGALVNLTLDQVEELQVVNYGIGGHYEPHFDFARKEEEKAFDEEMGNRILTFICYMSNVEVGGSTVFPDIGVELRPKEGSCAVWFNLNKNGDGDHSTRHAACPVLLGNKWVANKWFHERGQEFVRSCSLNPGE